MARVQVIDPKTATGAARQLLDAVQAQLGVTPNFIRVLANSPAALQGFLGLYGALGQASVDKATQERIALAVAEGNGCQYCARHCPVGAIRVNNEHAYMDPNRCIRCYCCHELCPQLAVELRRPWLGRLLFGE